MAVSPSLNAARDSARELFDTRPWYTNSRRIKLNLWILLLFATSYSGGYNSTILNGAQTLPQWISTFGYPTLGQIALLNSMQVYGTLAGMPFAPYASDILGRRHAVIIGAAFMCIASVLQTASTTMEMILAARFLLGFGLTLASNAAPILITELAYPNQRAQLTSAYNSFSYLGPIVGAWTAYGTYTMRTTSWAWRLPSVLQIWPSLLQVLLLWWCPESVRWLAAHGREDEARAVLAYYHGRGQEGDALVQYEYNEIRGAIKLDSRVAATTLSTGGWRALFVTRGNRRRLGMLLVLALFSQWCGTSVVEYYLTEVALGIGIRSVNGLTIITGVLQVFLLVVSLIGSAVVEKAGRRTLFLTSTAGMLVTLTAFTVCTAVYIQHFNYAAAKAFLVIFYLFYGFYTLAYAPLMVSYILEILPFQLRAKGYMLFNLASTAFSLCSVYADPVALVTIGWKYYIVFDVFLAVQVVFLWFCIVETKHLTLEETAVLIDGEEKFAELSTIAEQSAHLVRAPSDSKRPRRFNSEDPHELSTIPHD